MKLIHCADIHLGSGMDSVFPKQISDERKQELRNTFKRMVAFAQSGGIRVIMLAGDVFDSDSPLKKDRDFFYSVVKNNPDIDFLYLRGNHDSEGGSAEVPPNLKLFSGEWTSYRYGGVTVSGIEINGENCTSLYSTLSLDGNEKNIVMLHGQTGSGRDNINLLKLKNKNIDYLALGHIHSYSSAALDGRGVYAYSGCLEGRGFDEAGEKGFCVVEVTENGISHKFVPFAERSITEVFADVSGLQDAYSAYLKIKREVSFAAKDIYRVILTGELDVGTQSLAEDVEKYLGGECYYINVKDRTRRKIDVHAYDGDNSLAGEFVRTVYSSDLPDEDKLSIISCGLKALKGGGAEL